MKKRADGRFQESFSFEGSRYYVYGQSRKECRQKLEQKRKEVEAGYIASEKITVNEYFFEWTTRREKMHLVTPSTSRTEQSRFKAVAEEIGKCQLRKLEPRRIKRLQESLLERERMSAEGVNMCMALLSSVLKSAVEDRIIPSNPCSSIKRLKRDTPKATAAGGVHRALSPDEQTIFFDYASGTYYYNLYRFMIQSGLRCGEACGLKWSDIDRKEKVIRVHATVAKSKDGDYLSPTPKTSESNRDIPLTDPLLMVLKAQKKDMLAVFGSVAIQTDSHIFQNNKGGLVSVTSVDGCIRRIIKKINVEGVDFKPFTCHSFRDTFASTCAAQGMPIKVLQKILGHQTFQMTSDLYYQLYDDQKREEFEKISFAI